MKPFRPAALLLLIGLLVLLLYLRSQSGQDQVGWLFAQLAAPGSGGIELETERSEIQHARDLPAAQRIDVLLDLVRRGSGRATGEVERWSTMTYRAGSLSVGERERLEQIARRGDDQRVRRAAATLLLAETDRGHAPPSLRGVEDLPPDGRATRAWTLGLWRLRGQRLNGALAWLSEQTEPQQPLPVRRQAWRSVAAFGSDGLPLLLRGLGDPTTGKSCAALADGLLDLAVTATSSQERAVPRAIAVLRNTALPAENREAARAYLEGISERHLGMNAAAWQRWWEERQGAVSSPQ